MSDDNNSGGIVGAVISLLVLAFLWPYLLALLGLYIAYMVALAVLEWMAQNPITVVFMLLGAISIYAIFRYRLISKAWRWLLMQLQPKAVDVDLSQNEITELAIDLTQRKFFPSTNLYCYWCTKKLGIKAWEKNGKYYCDECKTKQLANL